MPLPMGHRTTRVRISRGPIERTDARGSHSNPPSPETHARVEDQREQNIDRWDETDLAREFTQMQALLLRSEECFSRGGEYLARGRDFLSQAEEVADGIAQRLNDGGVRLPRLQRRTSRESDDRTSLPPLNDPIWELMAFPGIGQVHLGEATNGNVPVSIDGAEKFPLTAAAADLLAVFLEDDRRDDDGFPPFRSYRDLAKAYSARRGIPAGERAVVVGISRLRKQLLAAGKKSPALVEVRNGSARLRIRRAVK